MLLPQRIEVAHANYQRGADLQQLVDAVRRDTSLPPEITNRDLRDAIVGNTTAPVWAAFDRPQPLSPLQAPGGQSAGDVVRSVAKYGRSGAVTDPATLTGADARAKIARRWADLPAAARRNLVRAHQTWAPHMPIGEFKKLVERDLGTLRIEDYRNYFSHDFWPLGPSTFDDATFEDDPNFLLRRMHRRMLWTVFGMKTGTELPLFSGADLMKVYASAEGHAKPKLGDTWFWGAAEENGHSAMFLGDVSELHGQLQKWFPNDNPKPGEPTFDYVWNHICQALYADVIERGGDPRKLPADDPRRLVMIQSLATGEGSHSTGKRLTHGVANEVLTDSHRIGVILDTAGDYMKLYPRNNWSSVREYFWHDPETARSILEPLAAHDPRVREVIARIDRGGEALLDEIRKQQVLSAFGLVGQEYGWDLDTGDHLEDDGVVPEWAVDEGTRIRRDTPLRSNQSMMDIHCSEVPTIAMTDALAGTGLAFPDLGTIAVDFESGKDKWGFVRNTIRGIFDFDTFADVPQVQAMSRTALFVNGNQAGIDFHVHNMERSFRAPFSAIIADQAYQERMRTAAERLGRDFDPRPEPVEDDPFPGDHR